ncbi:TPA: iron ABC transporter ATP-binding protein [Candidatus Sumerlaeota bacterium]|jgi:iron complex transport system ATP-binding protein|nr:iron ABC transporter ATP-binding protein [Candidatus Sumerlaeota bacterium]
MLEAQALTCGYGKRAVVCEANLRITPGEVVCLLGPNGSGKTTFFKTLLGFLKPLGGRILIQGEDVLKWSRNQLARTIAYVPQSHTPTFPFRVLDVVTMGRVAHLGLFASPSRSDMRTSEKALEAVGMGHLAEKPYTEISGGERQMILIARALAQEARLMIMDEPTSSLDFGNQIRLLKHVRKLADSGMGILMTTHLPNHAMLCGNRVAVIDNGRMRLAGKPGEVLDERCLKEIYGINVRVLDTENMQGESMKTCVPMLD